jgi:uncharacterized protein YqgC (DUF456 family)
MYTLIGGGAILLSTLANVFGTRVAGGSRAGMLGGTVGLLVGLVVGGPIGLLVGPFLGAVLFELATGTEARRSIRSGVGAAVGLLAGRIMELAIGVGLVASFVYAVATA